MIERNSSGTEQFPKTRTPSGEADAITRFYLLRSDRPEWPYLFCRIPLDRMIPTASDQTASAYSKGKCFGFPTPYIAEL